MKIHYLQDGRNRTTYYVSPSYETVVDEYGVARNTRYVWANGERLVEIADNGSKTFYLNDHLGSSSVLVNQSGQAVDRASYYPFGAVKSGGSASLMASSSRTLTAHSSPTTPHNSCF
ncbi:MAG: hypothetical protein V1744_05860 [Candidatus Altiarchaeota archaeon]